MLSTSRLGVSFSMMTRLLLNKRCMSDNSRSGNNNSNDGDTGAKSTPNNQLTKENNVNSNQNEDGPILLSVEDSFGKKDNKGKGEGTRPVFNPEELEEEEIKIEDLTPPTNCCMTGCPNCVWLEYAENLTKVYTNPELTKEKVMREIMAMEDQNIKAFIMFELRIRGLL